VSTPLRAVADTNVLIAASIKPRGPCGELLLAAIAQRWRPVVSPLLLTELEEVLRRPISGDRELTDLESPGVLVQTPRTFLESIGETQRH
jgi:hypothetical protein